MEPALVEAFVVLSTDVRAAMNRDSDSGVAGNAGAHDLPASRLSRSCRTPSRCACVTALDHRAAARSDCSL
jgi:hypothetical protein